MTTQKMYETVLETFGFTMQERKLGKDPCLQLKDENLNLFATFFVEPHKTYVRISGGGRGGAIDTGNIRVSEMQLNALLTILIQGHM